MLWLGLLRFISFWLVVDGVDLFVFVSCIAELSDATDAATFYVFWSASTFND